MMANLGLKKWLALALGVLCLGGCGKGGGKTRNPTEERLYKIGKAYRDTCFRLETAPKSFDEIKPSLEGDIPEDLLVSPNDGQAFVIIWGVNVNNLVPSRNNPFTVIGYERIGVDGTRYVLRAPLGIVKMTDEEFEKANFPPGHRAPG